MRNIDIVINKINELGKNAVEQKVVTDDLKSFMFYTGDYEEAASQIAKNFNKVGIYSASLIDVQDGKEILKRVSIRLVNLESNVRKKEL